MSLLDDLRSGVLGLRLTPPADLRPLEGGGWLDEASALVWWTYFEPGLSMDLRPAHRAHLRRHLERHARRMFEATFRQVNANAPDARPRTADQTWSPMIEVEHLEIDGSPALWTLHRMLYQPGREFLLGHLLVPLEAGLFELRLGARADSTGYRESALLLMKQAGRPVDPADPFFGMTQADYDAPEHDAKFPRHPVSRARAARLDLLTRWGIAVTRPPAAAPDGPVVFPDATCRLTPPPRFVARPTGSGLTRGSFCPTDGVERLYVGRFRESNTPPDFRAYMVRQVRAVHEGAGVSDIRIHAEHVPDHDNRPAALAVIDGIGHQGELRNALLWFQDRDGSICRIEILGATPASPIEELSAELRDAFASFETVEPPKPPPRPWWKLW